MTSEIDKLKHFYIEDYSGIYFTDDEWSDKMTANDYTHLFGYLNPYYRSAYNVSKRRK